MPQTVKYVCATCTTYESSAAFVKSKKMSSPGQKSKTKLISEQVLKQSTILENARHTVTLSHSVSLGPLNLKYSNT